MPPELIAHEPVEPRDSSRLLVYLVDRDEIILDTFRNISRYIPNKSLLVLNDTRVIPARLSCTKENGKSVNILFLFNEWDRGVYIRGLPDRRLDIGETVSAAGRPAVRVVSQKNQEFTFELLVSPDEFERLCMEQGMTPLPPYIHSSLSESDARERYQTIFADEARSVAAPTASLHFTERVFNDLFEKGVERAQVTLHVGRGTFSPVTEEMRAEGRLHSEPVIVDAPSADMIASAKSEGRMIIAAGTTALRALESAAPELAARRPFRGDTTLMIQPPYDFRIVDGLITNFHLPGTSLLMLVDALLQDRGARRNWRELYELAIKERFRFYSFGDAMLIV